MLHPSRFPLPPARSAGRERLKAGDPAASPSLPSPSATRLRRVFYFRAGSFKGFRFYNTDGNTLTGADFGYFISVGAPGAAPVINLPNSSSFGNSAKEGGAITIENLRDDANLVVRVPNGQFWYYPPAGLTNVPPSRDLLLGPRQTVVALARGTLEWNPIGGSWRSLVGLGTAATKNVGSSANNVVQLDGSGRLPAVDGSQLTNIPTAWPTGALFGLTLSQASSTTVGVAVGGCRNEDGGTAYNMVLASAITKGLGAWAAGSGNGGLDTGSIAASSWYHIHLIRKDADGTIDALLSLSATAPTMPGGYSARRRLGSIRTNGASQVIAFVQIGNRFIWDVPVIDVSVAAPGTTAVVRTLTAPTGIVVEADIVIAVMAQAGVAPSAWVSPLAIADTAPSTSSASPLNGPLQTTSLTAGYWTTAPARVMTNTSAQVRSRLSASSSNVQFGIITLGWLDERGKS